MQQTIYRKFFEEKPESYVWPQLFKPVIKNHMRKKKIIKEKLEEAEKLLKMKMDAATFGITLKPQIDLNTNIDLDIKTEEMKQILAVRDTEATIIKTPTLDFFDPENIEAREYKKQVEEEEKKRLEKAKVRYLAELKTLTPEEKAARKRVAFSQARAAEREGFRISSQKFKTYGRLLRPLRPRERRTDYRTRIERVAKTFYHKMSMKARTLRDVFVRAQIRSLKRRGKHSWDFIPIRKVIILPLLGQRFLKEINKKNLAELKEANAYYYESGLFGSFMKFLKKKVDSGWKPVRRPYYPNYKHRRGKRYEYYRAEAEKQRIQEKREIEKRVAEKEKQRLLRRQILLKKNKYKKPFKKVSLRKKLLKFKAAKEVKREESDEEKKKKEAKKKENPWSEMSPEEENEWSQRISLWTQRKKKSDQDSYYAYLAQKYGVVATKQKKGHIIYKHKLLKKYFF